MIKQEKDSSVMLVHNLCYTTIPSLLQLLYAIDEKYTLLPFDYVLFDITQYTEPDQLDPTQVILNAAGKLFVKAIPPFKQMLIDEVVYIGITKQQLGKLSLAMWNMLECLKIVLSLIYGLQELKMQSDLEPLQSDINCQRFILSYPILVKCIYKERNRILNDL